MEPPEKINPNNSEEDFVTLLTGHQDILLSFIRGSISDIATAKDILQEVNLILWKKSAQFKKGTNFGAWAFKIARFQILANYRDLQRSKLIYDENLVTQMAEEIEHMDAEWKNEERLKALEFCLKKLPKEHRALLDSRYRDGNSIQELGNTHQSSLSRIKVMLFRSRKNLRDCIQNQIKTLTPKQGGDRLI